MFNKFEFKAGVLEKIKVSIIDSFKEYRFIGENFNQDIILYYDMEYVKSMTVLEFKNFIFDIGCKINVLLKELILESIKSRNLYGSSYIKNLAYNITTDVTSDAIRITFKEKVW